MFVKTTLIVCSSVNKGFLFWGVHRETVLQFINKIDRLLHSLVKLMKLNSIVKGSWNYVSPHYTAITMFGIYQVISWNMCAYYLADILVEWCCNT
jgi:hypothetical protein